MDRLLGKRIRELRISRHFTQEQVADALNMSRQRYARIESGIVSISVDILAKIAVFFGVSLGDITKVLDTASDTAVYRAVDEGVSGKAVFEMLDFFYANKHLYMKLQKDSEE